MVDEHLLDAAARLEQQEQIWLFSLRRAPAWIEEIEGDDFYRPYLALVVEHDEGVVRAHDMKKDKPASEDLHRVILQAMLFPASGSGTAYRPREIRCDDEVYVAELQKLLAPLDIVVTTYLNLPAIDVCLREMAISFDVDGQARPHLVDIPGLETGQLAAFYLAAANYFQKAPWRKVADDQIVAVHIPSMAEPVYAVILGAGGEVEGLALYQTLGPLRYAQAGLPALPTGDGDNVISMLYSEMHEISFAELDALEFHQWPIAGPTAYPLLMKLGAMAALEQLTLTELQQLTAVITVLPAFVEAHMKRKPKKTVTDTVTLADGTEVKLVTPVEVPPPDPAEMAQTLSNMLANLDSDLPFDPTDLLASSFMDEYDYDDEEFALEIETFSEGWLPDNVKSRRRYAEDFVKPLATDLFDFLIDLSWQGYAASTMEKHEKNAWAIGWLMCNFRLAKQYDPTIFHRPPQLLEEFKQHFSAAKTRVASYEATWNKLGQFIIEEGYG